MFVIFVVFSSLTSPKLVEALAGKKVTNISCGSGHSAAIVDDKELYTWGIGDFGRLGHGNEESFSTPKLVSQKVVE